MTQTMDITKRGESMGDEQIVDETDSPTLESAEVGSETAGSAAESSSETTESDDTAVPTSRMAVQRARIRAGLRWPATASDRAWGRALGVLGVVGLALVGGLVYLWIAASHGAADEAAGGGALAAAKKDVPTLLSYDYKTVDITFPAAAQSILTGGFQNDYRQLGLAVIQPEAKKKQVVTRAQVVDGGVISSTRDAVSVLLFVDQTTTSNDQTGQRLDGSRIRIDLVRVGADWKISALTPI
ncbi:hypothetical protein HH308_29000 [Gordonia sp. TBRC 11910]|uniref:Mce-associated membrane protein n=1 Tax=Gordonia asplenii TaxID=2725283 RepID=A0A848L356_9ACTN|nr:hypothetical protein [Gordonia asplenii]NMO05264.1 hypothetical protein [Gordonia asplenii]